MIPRTACRGIAAVLSGACAAALVLALAASPAEAGKREKALEAIRLAEIEFARAVQSKDRDRFLSFLAEEATFYGRTDLRTGPEGILEAWSVLFDPDAEVALTWKPLVVEASKSGDLGYAVGEYEQTTVDANGNKSLLYGHYVTIWRKVDGAWKAVLDIGTTPASERLPQPGGSEER
jgi:ketosteroid isomerase-like protein